MVFRAHICLIFFFILMIYRVHSQYQSCASGWTLYDNELFHVTRTAEINYAHARATCQNYGGDLAVIKTREQYHFLVELLPTGPAYYWIGLTDLENRGTWRWVDGSYFDPKLPVWGPNQPDGGEHCMIFVSHTDPRWDHKWADYGCNKGNVRSICAREFVLPGLSQPPTLKEKGANHVVVAWQPWQDTTDSGEGPASGYRIYFRLAAQGEDSTSWTLAGYRAERDDVADHGDLVFNVTGLESSTEYEIAITVIHLCTGREGNKGPLLEVVTRSKPPESALDRPPSYEPCTLKPEDNVQPVHDSPGGSNPIILWALFGVAMVLNVICGIIIAALCLCRKRSDPSEPVEGTSKTSGLYNNPAYEK